MKIVVCSLAALRRVIVEHEPSHVVTLLSDEGLIEQASAIAPEHHLRLAMNDIELADDGMVSPERAHLEELIHFVDTWDREKPMIIHCWAGISRSTAAAFTALCRFNPSVPERSIARALRDASPVASPNRLIVAHADSYLGRDGRMIEAINGIGRGRSAWQNDPFSLPVEFGAEV